MEQTLLMSTELDQWIQSQFDAFWRKVATRYQMASPLSSYEPDPIEDLTLEATTSYTGEDLNALLADTKKETVESMTDVPLPETNLVIMEYLLYDEDEDDRSSATQEKTSRVPSPSSKRMKYKDTVDTEKEQQIQIRKGRRTLSTAPAIKPGTAEKIKMEYEQLEGVYEALPVKRKPRTVRPVPPLRSTDPDVRVRTNQNRKAAYDYRKAMIDWFKLETV
jgi:hypothetical protein